MIERPLERTRNVPEPCHNEYRVTSHHAQTACAVVFSENDTGYPHDGRADNTAYRHDRRADKRRYPHDREIDIQMLKMSRNGYILS